MSELREVQEMVSSVSPPAQDDRHHRGGATESRMKREAPVTVASSIELRLRYLAPHIHDLGEGPLFHLFRELAAGADLLPLVETYASLPADIIRAYRGGRLAPVLAVIGGSS